MKNIKKIILSLGLIMSFNAFADVAEVYQWKAFPGKTQQMLESMQKASAIHEKEGAQVAIDILNVGSTPLINYVMRWDDSQKYAKFKDNQNQSAEWLEYWAEVNQSPSGEMVASFSANNLDQSKKASDFNGTRSGHVRVYEWNGSTWVQRGGDIDGEAAYDHSGCLLYKSPRPRDRTRGRKPSSA